MKAYPKLMTFATIMIVLVFGAAATVMMLTVQPAKAIVGPCSGCSVEAFNGHAIAISPGGKAEAFSGFAKAEFPFPSCHGCSVEAFNGHVIITQPKK